MYYYYLITGEPSFYKVSLGPHEVSYAHNVTSFQEMPKYNTKMSKFKHFCYLELLKQTNSKLWLSNI